MDNNIINKTIISDKEIISKIKTTPNGLTYELLNGNILRTSGSTVEQFLNDIKWYLNSQINND